MLGVDYGPDYWCNSRKVPEVYFKNANPIPRSSYTNRNFSLNIIPVENPNDINAANVTDKTTWTEFKELLKRCQEGNLSIIRHSVRNGTRVGYVDIADLERVLQSEGSSYAEVLGKVTDYFELSEKIEEIFCKHCPEFKGFLDKDKNPWVFAGAAGITLKPSLNQAEKHLFLQSIQKLDIQNCLKFKKLEGENYRLVIPSEKAYDLARKLDKIGESATESRRCVLQ